VKVLILLVASILAFATSGQDVKKKTVEAGETAVEYTKEQKDAFVHEMEENIDAVKKEIKTLKSKANQKADEKIKKLEEHQGRLEADLKRLKKSSGKAWQEIRKGTSSAWDQLKAAVSNAKKELQSE
jgi:TolA-binding protein